jgi:hypothetical protein
MPAPTAYARRGTVASTAVPAVGVAAAGVVSSDITGMTSVPGQDDWVVQGSARRTGYDHLSRCSPSMPRCPRATHAESGCASS